jgi:P-type conjugative transfer protein TrbJ
VRRSVIGTLLITAAMAVKPASGQFGVGLATETTQILNHGELVVQYIRQGQQLANELNMYAEMIRNGSNLPSQTFGAIAADLNALGSIVQGGQALAYSLSNLDAIFRATFQGYGILPNSYYPNYQNWAKTSLDTTLGALRAAGLQGQQLASEQTVLDSLRNMAASSDGRMQALQVMGEISEQQVQQLMKLREIMLADMSSKQAYQATVIQRQAASEAATERFFTAGPSNGDGRRFRPGLN